MSRKEVRLAVPLPTRGHRPEHSLHHGDSKENSILIHRGRCAIKHAAQKLGTEFPRDESSRRVKGNVRPGLGQLQGLPMVCSRHIMEVMVPPEPRAKHPVRCAKD